MYIHHRSDRVPSWRLTQHCKLEFVTQSAVIQSQDKLKTDGVAQYSGTKVKLKHLQYSSSFASFERMTINESQIRWITLLWDSWSERLVDDLFYPKILPRMAVWLHWGDTPALLIIDIIDEGHFVIPYWNLNFIYWTGLHRGQRNMRTLNDCNCYDCCNWSCCNEVFQKFDLHSYHMNPICDLEDDHHQRLRNPSWFIKF